MAASVYLETTIPSYLTARASRDLIFLANQQLTREWWDTRRSVFELFVSQFVLDEAAAGDREAAARRIGLLRELEILEVTPECLDLGRRLVVGIPLPPKAATDAFHVAVAAIHGIDYLLTWNCAHLANAALRSRIESVCELAGVSAPIICTPQELMEI
jgi:predicted nucleic acid-binding protein